MNDVEHARRQARLGEQSPSASPTEGTFSDGFSTKVLPQVIATGNIHSGTIDGKLNGVIPTHTPTGCRLVSQSTLGARFSKRLAHQQAGNAAGEFDHLDAALHLGAGFGECFAVFARHQRGQLLEMAHAAIAGSETSPEPARPRAFRSRPVRRRPPRARPGRLRPRCPEARVLARAPSKD